MKNYIPIKCDTKQFRRIDTIFNEYIRLRDGACLYCGSTQKLNCSHITSRRIFSGRWDELNAITLCESCHRKVLLLNPVLFSDWLRNLYPASYERSIEVLKEDVQVSNEYLDRMEYEVNKMLEKLKQYLSKNRRVRPERYFGIVMHEYFI